MFTFRCYLGPRFLCVRLVARKAWFETPVTCTHAYMHTYMSRYQLGVLQQNLHHFFKSLKDEVQFPQIPQG